TTTNQYDYVVGFGTIAVDTLYRDGPNDTLVTITPAEFSVSTTLYPGLTVVRFLIRQVNFVGGFHTIFADVQGASRDFSDAIKEVLTNTTWGLGQAVDAASFATAKADLAAFGGLYCDGVANQQAQAQDLLRLLMIVRGMRLGFNSSNQWTLTVDKVPIAIKMRLRDGVGDGERNIQQAGQRQLVPTTSAVSKYTIKYRLNFPNGGTSSDYDFSLFRSVNSFGKETVLEHPLIREHETADRVVDYLAKREKFGQDSCDFDATQEARQLREGDLVQVTYTPNGYSNTIAEVREIEKRTDLNHIVVSGWDASIFVYQPGPLPVDTSDVVATLFIPRPGYLEILNQRLNHEFITPDITLRWAKTSELFVGAQDEDNLQGLQIQGYWVQVFRSAADAIEDFGYIPGIKVREEFVLTPAYIYTLAMNKADNPPFGARVLTFVIFAQAVNGAFGEPNYISVYNTAQNLGPLAVGPVVDTDLATESVQVSAGFQPGNVFDVVGETDFADVLIGGGRQIRVFDDLRGAYFDFVTVKINVVTVNVSDYAFEYDAVERIESGQRGQFVVDTIAPSDDVSLVSNVVAVNVNETIRVDIGFFFDPNTHTVVNRESVTIARS
ncbi:MAG TPA: hypothetical protein VLA89_07120, partial [Gemmatimonadales bacterium]|nr:hypothetical protein [Gemmatimonadales bacterium]